MQIIFSDNHVLIVVKPAGLSTQPHYPIKDNLTDLTKTWVKKEYKKPGGVYLECIHRLDKPVSGLVLFARTSKALTRLQQSMREKKMSKTYLAWVERGENLKNSGVLEHTLTHVNHRAKVVKSNHIQGKLAQLEYSVMLEKGDFSLVKIKLYTGRYHQVRAQFSAIGSPVVGDVKYGSKKHLLKQKIALHHACMSFPHPITQEVIVCEEILDWQKLL
ncbi:Ribosomal large subunit pseudouridine synthase C [Candidatus Rhabdochlamydia oedothoracis]|uniref:Ribosomal large subunit pseudouridine synthase C n=1 Tax=Candidatus Rhabdochlamydia oedothoracis TaxID=2720720 RepID=A0ABX8V4F9_9BACT|nr:MULTISPECIES: RNA pseudouridine synthase [Rhabdochlamydia]KAG6558912.1 Ribosomal large subunit pseudouridine synthase C [Candidatus Rhabdochlamydia sp. W815]MCL6756381.1 RNA pseudouridine synthase [Candidatus Rhabdochlamydia oedothoracis]QYF49387.1 Ribosomal large subunit pseudouridine synthase C [Candidatus Rhabdochlamydia oedothoracis]